MNTPSGTRHFGMFRAHPLSGLERACLRVLLSFGHRVSVFTYQSAFVVPAGVVVRDARDILERRHETRFFTDGAPDAQSFADFFRYEMILKEGLSAIAPDVLMLGALSLPEDADLLVRCPQGGFNPAILSLRDREVVADLCHCVRRMAERVLKPGATGALALGRVAADYRQRVEIAPAGLLETIGAADLCKLVLPDHAQACAVRYGAAMAVQIRPDVLTEIGLPAPMAPPAGSYLHACLERSGALVEFEGGLCPEDVLRRRMYLWRERQRSAEPGVRAFVRRAFPGLARNRAPHLPKAAVQ